MNQEITIPLMTCEEFLTLPADGMDRELVRGRLREGPITYRNPQHSEVEAAIAGFLGQWRKTLAKPWGKVLSGEAGFRILHDPDTVVGIDVAYIAPELAAQTAKGARVIDGKPVLAVEILSPSDTQQHVTDRIQEFLEAKIPLVWIVEPVFQTVTVFRLDALPQMFNREQTLNGSPHLPGLVIELKELFEMG